MGLEDKVSNAAENLGGKAKETVGEVTGDDKLKAEGQGDQLSAKIKEGYEDVKDALEDGAEKVKDFVGDLADKISEGVDKATADKSPADSK